MSRLMLVLILLVSLLQTNNTSAHEYSGVQLHIGEQQLHVDDDGNTIRVHHEFTQVHIPIAGPVASEQAAAAAAAAVDYAQYQHQPVHKDMNLNEQFYETQNQRPHHEQQVPAYHQHYAHPNEAQIDPHHQHSQHQQPQQYHHQPQHQQQAMMATPPSHLGLQHHHHHQHAVQQQQQPQQHWQQNNQRHLAQNPPVIREQSIEHKIEFNEDGRVRETIKHSIRTYENQREPARNHADSCDSTDDSSIFSGQSTCQKAPVAPNVPGFAQQHQHTNRPSHNSNVVSYPLAPQPYHYESSLMTAILHYWREISGLCLASAIFLNWLFVVVKRRFVASGFSRHIDINADQLAETIQNYSGPSTPKSLSKDSNIFNSSAHDSAFEETASPIDQDDACSSSSQESSLGSRPRSLSSSAERRTHSQPSSSLNSSSYTSDYISRYSSDFDSIRRLGRGGFGIVFEAKNKIDDCHYAVKRICLPLEKEARERVMREVRALAKLDHAGIVRYYNAWLETPPDEWLKQHDAQLGIVHTRDGLSFPSTDGIYERNESDLITGDVVSGRGGDQSNEFFGSKSLFKNHRANGYSDLKEHSASLDIVFEGSGSIRLEAENNTEESEQQSASLPAGLHVEKVYLYIQMQLCRKDTLKDWLKTNCENRDKTTIFDFFYQIVDAVEYVHSQDLIHRDLKPSNIFFSLDGTLKIGDFGLCRAKTNVCVGSSLDLKDYVADYSEAVHTEQVGTQLYMSPEQMNGLSYNHKVDIFAMGLILLELLIPFKTQMQRVNVLLKARNNMFSREFKNDHPDEHELVRSLLDRRPYKRPTATAIKEHELLANAQLSQPVIERIYHRRRTVSSNSSTE